MDPELEVTSQGALMDSRPKVTSSYGALMDSELKATFRTAWTTIPCRKETLVMDSELKATSHGALMNSRPKVASSYGALMDSELKVTSLRGVVNDSVPQEAVVASSELRVTSLARRALGLGAEGCSTRGALMDSGLKVTSSHGVPNDSIPQEAFVTNPGLRVTSSHGALTDSEPKVTLSHDAPTNSQLKATSCTACLTTPCRRKPSSWTRS